MKKQYYIPTIEVTKMDFPIWMAIDSSDHDGDLGGHAPERRESPELF